MIRYSLDSLGWYSFESLIQSLLKAELGLGVQSWGESGDIGRDAYSEGPLAFPDRSNLEAGPFIFQMKFISNANAKGSKTNQSVLSAVRAEIHRIQKHIAASKWVDPRYYIFFTNARVPPSLRTEIKNAFQTVMPSTSIFPNGGKDVCDLLDNNPKIRHSFPQVLSLRDIDKLILESVHSRIIQRSRAAIDEAASLAHVFIPTKAYYRAFGVLMQSHFVVLDGPPEMGKTAIARILSLVFSFDGFEVIECRHPDDFFSVYASERKQIFIADDAFGRTEYDISLGRQWEKDLAKILHRTNEKHLLIWTSRRHILQYALSDLDLAPGARHFPQPGEVIVDASDLSVEEKALILYRHGRSANLDSYQRDSIRNMARMISTNVNFTPERIRRLFSAEFKIDWQQLKPDEIQSLIEYLLSNPTDHMKKSFDRLPIDYKWFLISLLEHDSFFDLKESHRVHLTNRLPYLTNTKYEQILKDLDGAFIRLDSSYRISRKRLKWIHPSYRDMIIDFLEADSSLQVQFIKTTTERGLSLALSVSGSQLGERAFPFAVHPLSIKAIHDRCIELVSENPESRETVLIIDILQNAIDNSRASTKLISPLTSTILEVASVLKNNLQADSPIRIDLLEMLAILSDKYPGSISFPDVLPTLDQVLDEIRNSVSHIQPYSSAICDIDFSRLSYFIDMIHCYGKENKSTSTVNDKIKALFGDIGPIIESNLNALELTDDPKLDETTAQDLKSFKEPLDEIESIHTLEAISSIIRKTESEIDYLEQDLPYDNFTGDSPGPSGSADFSVEFLFSDF